MADDRWHINEPEGAIYLARTDSYMGLHVGAVLGAYIVRELTRKSLYKGASISRPAARHRLHGHRARSLARFLTGGLGELGEGLFST